MERKIIFLDIEGVLLPLNAEKQFDHVYLREKENDMPNLYERLEYKFKIDYRKYHPYDVINVFFDWNKESLALLKLTLSLTGAQFVLSSNWQTDGYDRMKDFFTIHGLEEYYIGNTRGNYVDKAFIEEAKAKFKEKNGENSYLDYRSIQILEWLSMNPDVTKWVVIDDMQLSGLDGHLIRTNPRYTWEDAEKAIRILTDCP